MEYIRFMIKRIYSLYCALMFAVTFLLVYPFFLLAIWVPGWWRMGFYTNVVWAKMYFPLVFMRIQIFGRENLRLLQTNCIICVNHFSYLDIPVMAVLPRPFVFVGKASVAKIPLFGYMFRKLHVPVDRNSRKSRYETYLAGGDALDMGKDLLFFPEGGIISGSAPQMVPFKDGAFRLAIEKQKPILPITLLDNWHNMPDDSKLMPTPGLLRMIIHKPILPPQNSVAKIQTLKQKCYDVIDGELQRSYPNLFETAK